MPKLQKKPYQKGVEEKPKRSAKKARKNLKCPKLEMPPAKRAQIATRVEGAMTTAPPIIFVQTRWTAGRSRYVFVLQCHSIGLAENPIRADLC